MIIGFKNAKNMRGIEILEEKWEEKNKIRVKIYGQFNY